MRLRCVGVRASKMCPYIRRDKVNKILPTVTDCACHDLFRSNCNVSLQHVANFETLLCFSAFVRSPSWNSCDLIARIKVTRAWRLVMAFSRRETVKIGFGTKTRVKILSAQSSFSSHFRWKPVDCLPRTEHIGLDVQFLVTNFSCNGTLINMERKNS